MSEQTAAEKAEAWDALVALLPLTGEWHRGAVLAKRGDLLSWVMKNDPRQERNSAPTFSATKQDPGSTYRRDRDLG